MFRWPDMRDDRRHSRRNDKQLMHSRLVAFPSHRSRWNQPHGSR